MCRFLLLSWLFCFHLSQGLSQDTVFQLAAANTPIAARQEKAQLLTRLWNLESGFILDEFPLETESGLVKTQKAFEAFLSASAHDTDNFEIPSRVDHYLVWMLARVEMVNSLDFSDAALRHFYKINPKQYPCKASASISEFLVPHSYLNELGTTTVLKQVKTRLQREKFAHVCYDITGQISGNPETGLKGIVTAGQVGEQRFKLYQKIWEEPDYTSLAGRGGGPIEVETGYLFVEVYNFSSGDGGSCYEYYSQQISQDYGREWLKKIYSDTLTTAMRELRPEVTSFTSNTKTDATAYIVDGHKSTFSQAHELLPYLVGNGRDSRFWQSIQRQALEVELIYHSNIGKRVRAGNLYRQMKSGMSALRAAKANLDQRVKDMITTDAVQREYSENNELYSQPVTMSFTLYSCDDNPEGAAMLKKISEGSDYTTSSLQVTEKNDVLWSEQPREIQVAAQSLRTAQWSDVFPFNGKPHLLYLHSIERQPVKYEELTVQIREQMEIKLRQQFWHNYFQIDNGPGDEANKPQLRF